MKCLYGWIENTAAVQMSVRDGRGDYPRAFSAMLQEFRDDGCNILVTGTDELTDTAEATRIFMGAPNKERYRLLAFTALDSIPTNVDRFLPGDVTATDDSVTVVDRRTVARNATTDTPGDTAGIGPTPADASTPETNLSLATFQTGISTRLAAIEETASSFAPASLRLSLIYLHGLVESYGIDRVTQFCRVIAAQVRGLAGMAYYHLGTTPPNPWVDEFRPVFDARIDLARRHGDLFQKWRVHEYDYETDWVPLEPPK